MGTMRVLGTKGDTELHFDEATFTQQLHKGLLAFSIPVAGADAIQTDDFDPTAHEILFAKPLAGG